MKEKLLAYALGPSTAIGAAGMILHEQYGNHAALLECSAAGVAALVAHESKQPLVWGVSGALAYGAAMTWLGFDPAAFWLWLTTSGAAFAARLLFEHKNRHHDVDGQIKLSRFQQAQARAEMAQMQLEQKHQLAIGAGDSAPVLTGHTPEETAIREAVYELYGVSLPGVHMQFDDWGWLAKISLPANLTRLKVKREWDEKMVNALALEGEYRLALGSNGNELLVRFLSSDPLEDLIPYLSEDLENVSQDIYLGPDEEAGRTLLNVLGKHVLILGTSGNGKSTLMQLLILRLFSAGAACVGIDMKRGVELEAVRPLLQTLADDADKARKVFEWLDEEVDRRSDIMKEAGVRKWTEKLGPYIWVFIDELSELTMKMNNKGEDIKLSEHLDSRLRTDRAFGIHYVCATQAPSKQAFGGNTDQKTNYKLRISTRLEEEGHAQFGFGVTWKTTGWDPNKILRGPGEILIRSEDHRQPIRRKVMMITDDDLDAEVERLAPEKVWLVGSPWGEGGAQLTPSQQVEMFLRTSGEVTRAQIEEATGLDRKQVLNAIMKLGSKVDRDTDQHTYWLASEGGGSRAVGQ